MKKKRKLKIPSKLECFVCWSPFEMVKVLYAMRYVDQWGVFICPECLCSSKRPVKV